MAAPRARTAPAAKTAAPNTDLASALSGVQVSSQGVKRAAPKTAKPILTLDHVRKSLEDNVALQYTVQTRELAEAIKSDLQRAASALKCGVSKSVTERDGAFVVDFQATNVKRKRNYTSDQIRQWARDVKGVDIPKTVKIPDNIRQEFRVTHGYAKAAQD